MLRDLASIHLRGVSMFASESANKQGSKMQTIQNTKLQGFFFRKRIEKIDWKRLAAVDVCQVANQMDIDALQENLVSVAFCDITSELDTSYMDTNFIKLFQLAQLLIEYLLYSQEFLTNSVEALKSEIKNMKNESDALRRRFDQQAQRLSTTRKECHRRRLLLLAQQQLMTAGLDSYNRCPHCPKAFVNPSFLTAHVHRRHLDVAQVVVVDRLTSPIKRARSLELEDRGRERVQVVKCDVKSNLEEQILEVLDHIRTKPQIPQPVLVSQPVEAKNLATPPCGPTTTPSSPSSTLKKRTIQLEEQLQAERDNMLAADERNRVWQIAIIDQHKADMMNMRSMFEIEMRNLREQNLNTQKDLIQLRAKRAASNFGDIEDDIPEQRKKRGKKRQTLHSEDLLSPDLCDMPSFSDVIPPSGGVANINNAGSWPNQFTLAEAFNNPSNQTVTTVTSFSIADSDCSHISPPPPPSVVVQTQTRVCNASMQTVLEHTNASSRSTQKSVILSAVRAGGGVVVEGLIVRTEDEEEAEAEAERNRSIHLIPSRPTPKQRSSSTSSARRAHKVMNDKMNNSFIGNGQVQIVDDISSLATETAPPQSRNDYPSEFIQPMITDKQQEGQLARQSSPSNLKPAFDSNMQLDLNPLHNVVRYGQLLEQLRSDPETLSRLRKEIELLLDEQLTDHSVQPNAIGIPSSTLNAQLKALQREREQMMRKHPSFHEIRSSISQQVDRMAVLALHSKRERTHSSTKDRSQPLTTENQAKKARTSRPLEPSQVTSTRITSLSASRAGSSSMLTATGSRRRLATASPTTRINSTPIKNHQLHESTASLFEVSEDRAIAERDPRASTRFDADELSMEAVESNPPIIPLRSQQVIHIQPLKSAYPSTRNPQRPSKSISSPSTTTLAVESISDGDWDSPSEDERGKAHKRAEALLEKVKTNISVKRTPSPRQQPIAVSGDADSSDDWDSDSSPLASSKIKLAVPVTTANENVKKRSMLAVNDLEINDLDDLLESNKQSNSNALHPVKPTVQFLDKPTAFDERFRKRGDSSIFVSPLRSPSLRTCPELRIDSPVRPKTSTGRLTTPLSSSPLNQDPSHTTSLWDSVSKGTCDEVRCSTDIRDFDDDFKSD